ASDVGFQPEATDVLMRPETVYFEIRPARPLPYAEIPLLLSLNERALIFGETRRVPAFRTEDDPLVYRTGPIRIADPMEDDELPDGAIRIGAYSGDRLTATLGLDAGMLIAGPPAATALIVDHPGEAQLMAAVSDGEPAFFWDRAVRDAAACHDIPSAGAAIDDLARQPAESINRYLLISWLDNDAWDLSKIGSRWGKESVPGRRDDAVFRLNVDISVGQHGAMILTRRALVNALKEQRRLLDELVGDGHIRGFRGTIERVMSGRTPWDDLKVTGPDGAQIFFPQTFYDGILERRYGLGGAGLIAYQLSATREALGLMKRNIEQAIALAAEPEDCDVEDMLILTGLGMRNVIERAKTVLMRCPDPDQSDRLGAAAALTGGRCRNWVADRRARAHMDALALIGASFSEQKAVAEWDHSVALLMASAVTMPVGAWGGAIGAGISAAVGTGGTIIGTVSGIATERAEQRELDFARGAAIAIGNDRYAVAREFDVSYVPVIINTMFGVFQIGNDIVSLRNAIGAQRTAAAAAQLRIRMEIQAAYREARVELGRILARQMLRREVSLASLNRQQAGDLSMA
ncbi:MAG TPA: hypothetical protein VK862_16225, partial [Afifellaceae bacterium]|nr:hypothetical protein [Afifellaceae bacterium]